MSEWLECIAFTIWLSHINKYKYHQHRALNLKFFLNALQNDYSNIITWLNNASKYWAWKVQKAHKIGRLGINKCNRFKRGWSTWCNISKLYFVRRPVIYLSIMTYIWLWHYNRSLNAPNYSAYFPECGKYGLAISQIMLRIH